MKKTVSIVGASGYTGVELVRMLLRHPLVELKHVYAFSSAGKTVAEVYPAFTKTTDLAFESIDNLAGDTSDFLFFALPHNESQKIIPKFFGKKKILDLGGDFRLKDAGEYERYYNAAHTAQELLPQAVYGMPELNAGTIGTAEFVANPGCYPTAAILALAPLAKNHILPDNVSIVSLSGVSGAGRTPSQKTHFAEANESVSAYKVGVHQHTPEIEQALGILAGKKITAAFVPHLLPITRGIHTTVAIHIMNNYTLADIRSMYAQFYSTAPFVRLLPEPPRILDVNHTNYCDIHIARDEHADTIVILSTIDNLIKGAAGQAIQNMNLMCGFTETAGLA